MMRVLVVDDELPVVQGISHIIKRDLGEEFEVAGSARSGKEAIEKAWSLAVDIVLLDVNMPGISGLEAAREICRRGPPPAFVLVTAYERFDIALEAVQLGIVDYLLKPVQKDKLAQALRKAANLILQRRSLDFGEIERREHEERLQPLVREAVMRAVMMGDGSGPAFRERLALAGLSAPFCFAVAIAFEPPSSAHDRKAWLRSVHATLLSSFLFKTDCLVGPLSDSLCAVLAPLESDSPASVRHAEASVAATLASLDAEGGIVRHARGKPVYVDEVARSWQSALAALYIDAPEEGSETPAGATRPDPDYSLDAEFLDALHAGNAEKARLALERILVRFDEDEVIPPRISFRLAGLFAAAYADFARRGILFNRRAAQLSDVADLATSQTGAALSMACRARFPELSQAASSGPRRSKAVVVALEFIQEHFSEPLSLDVAASAAGVSAGRLSRLFGDELGVGFSEYLGDLRIARAKELLSAPGASVKEVSAACGYADPNYFSRLFRKACGVSPTVFIAGSTEGRDD